MSKTAKRILAGALAGILLAGLSGCGVNRKELPGEIMFTSSLIDGTCEDGIVLYTPASKEWKTLLAGQYFGLCWHPDRTRALSQKKGDQYYTILFEYDLSAGTVTELLDLDTVEGLDSINFCYMPGSYDVSFVAEDRVKVLDRKTGEILDRTGPLSFDDYTTMAWDQTGTRFFYNDGDAGGIWRYDTATKEKQWIASGWDVALSPDDRYVAYKRSTDRLMIYDMQTGGEWECYHTHSGLGGVLQEYVFSPDSRYIAVSDGYTGLGGGGIDYLYAVDIETGDKIKLFKNYGGVTPLVWR